MRRLVFLATLSCCTPAAASPYHWTVAKNSRFEVYSQTGDATAPKALIWFEQLRTFFRQNGLLGASLDDQDRRALRVIGFRSEKEYEESIVSALSPMLTTSQMDLGTIS